jgi:hypothetical protein
MTHGFSDKMGAYKWAKLVKHNLDINIPEYTRMHQQSIVAEIELQMSRTWAQVSKPGSKTMEKKFRQEKTDKQEMQA